MTHELQEALIRATLLLERRLEPTADQQMRSYPLFSRDPLVTRLLHPVVQVAISGVHLSQLGDPSERLRFPVLSVFRHHEAGQKGRMQRLRDIHSAQARDDCELRE